jgi:hypothetical protein
VKVHIPKRLVWYTLQPRTSMCGDTKKQLVHEEKSHIWTENLWHNTASAAVKHNNNEAKIYILLPIILGRQHPITTRYCGIVLIVVINYSKTTTESTDLCHWGIRNTNRLLNRTPSLQRSCTSYKHNIHGNLYCPETSSNIQPLLIIYLHLQCDLVLLKHKRLCHAENQVCVLFTVWKTVVLEIHILSQLSD